MDLGDLLHLVLTPTDWIEDWTSWAKFFLIVVGIALIVLGATDNLQPVPGFVGYIMGPMMVTGSIFWIIRDRME